jgi:hypothetical protein
MARPPTPRQKQILAHYDECLKAQDRISREVAAFEVYVDTSGAGNPVKGLKKLAARGLDADEMAVLGACAGEMIRELEYDRGCCGIDPWAGPYSERDLTAALEKRSAGES